MWNRIFNRRHVSRVCEIEGGEDGKMLRYVAGCLLDASNEVRPTYGQWDHRFMVASDEYLRPRSTARNAAHELF